MRARWIFRGLLMASLAVVVLVAAGFAVMWLWNWLVPSIIGWKAIDFWQAAGLLVLARLLVGFRGGFGWGHRRHMHGHWRARMEERWERMTPEEREKFRDGMRGRCGHGRREAPPQAAA